MYMIEKCANCSVYGSCLEAGAVDCSDAIRQPPPDSSIAAEQQTRDFLWIDMFLCWAVISLVIGAFAVLVMCTSMLLGKF